MLFYCAEHFFLPKFSAECIRLFYSLWLLGDITFLIEWYCTISWLNLWNKLFIWNLHGAMDEVPTSQWSDDDSGHVNAGISSSGSSLTPVASSVRLEISLSEALILLKFYPFWGFNYCCGPVISFLGYSWCSGSFSEATRQRLSYRFWDEREPSRFRASVLHARSYGRLFWLCLAACLPFQLGTWDGCGLVSFFLVFSSPAFSWQRRCC